MSLELKIKDTLKLKKSNKFCAYKLNIPLETYMEIKKNIIRIK